VVRPSSKMMYLPSTCSICCTKNFIRSCLHAGGGSAWADVRVRDGATHQPQVHHQFSDHAALARQEPPARPSSEAKSMATSLSCAAAKRQLLYHRPTNCRRERSWRSSSPLRRWRACRQRPWPVVAACWRTSDLGMLRDFKIVARHVLNYLEKTVLEFQST
jgi:hypothetical protein